MERTVLVWEYPHTRQMDTPFNMLIVGKTECGKTHYLLDMLERDYLGHFDYIFLICPTYPWNKTYQRWSYRGDPKFVPVACDHDKVDSFLSYVSETFAGTNSLIVIDDCASGQAVKSRVSELVRLAFSARHYGLSVVMITQKMTAVTSSYRENISKMVIFRTHSMKVWDTVMEEYLKSLGANKDVLKDILGKLMSNKYARLEIELRHPTGYSVVLPHLEDGSESGEQTPSVHSGSDGLPVRVLPVHAREASDDSRR